MNDCCDYSEQIHTFLIFFLIKIDMHFNVLNKYGINQAINSGNVFNESVINRPELNEETKSLKNHLKLKYNFQNYIRVVLINIFYL